MFSVRNSWFYILRLEYAVIIYSRSFHVQTLIYLVSSLRIRENPPIHMYKDCSVGEIAPRVISLSSK